MPYMQAAIGHLNTILGNPELLQQNQEQLLELFAPADDLDGAREGLIGSFGQLLNGEGPAPNAVRGVETSTVMEHMQGIPPGIMDAGRAVIHRNLQRERPFGMTFAWAPGYDHEMTIWESPPTQGSPGWITVLIKGRYPGDQHPVTGKPMDELWG